MARNKEIEIDTRLGRRCIDADKVIHFPRGLAGFENERDFILLQIRPEAPLLILQSVNTPVVGLLVADPYSFFDKSYAPQVSDAEKQLLSIESLEQAALNLTGPIVINYEARVGLQVPQCVEGLQQVNLHSLKPVEEGQGASAAEGAKPQENGCTKADANK